MSPSGQKIKGQIWNMLDSPLRGAFTSACCTPKKIIVNQEVFVPVQRACTEFGSFLAVAWSKQL